MSTIINAFKEQSSQQYRIIFITLITISILFLCVIILATLFYKQKKQLSERRKELSTYNNSLEELNGKLHKLNNLLLDTNHKRESLVKLYIDLCSKYIDKLNNFQTLVTRKIKANQAKDLLGHIASSRLYKDEATTFLKQFDSAFLTLYPTFVEEFNRLLKPEYAFKVNNSLNTELRIYALIRLGVKSSSEISNLLFFSPQTIYNYRHNVKTKALSPDTFEQDVSKLCTVIHNNQVTQK